LAELEVLSYARKQRHAKLLEKVRSGDGLTSSELGELEEYEQAAVMPKAKENPANKKPRNDHERRELFCREYVKDFNKTQAAIRAGYSKKTADRQGSRLLKNAGLRKRVDELKKKAVEKTEITLNRVIEELARIGFSNVGNYLTFGKDGVELYESESLSKETLACIAEVSSGSTIRKRKGIKLKLHDKAKALNALLQYYTDFPSEGDKTKTIRSLLPIPVKK
jgi:phage terminase small subunit